MNRPENWIRNSFRIGCQLKGQLKKEDFTGNAGGARKG